MVFYTKSLHRHTSAPTSSPTSHRYLWISAETHSDPLVPYLVPYPHRPYLVPYLVPYPGPESQP